MRLKPKFDRVVIKRETMEDDLKSRKSVIILPEQANKQNPTERGTVLAVGPSAGLYRDGVLVETIEVGARVVFSRFAGAEVKAGEDVFFIVTDNDILAEIEED